MHVHTSQKESLKVLHSILGRKRILLLLNWTVLTELSSELDTFH
jgi:hypothetical protein